MEVPDDARDDGYRHVAYRRHARGLPASGRPRCAQDVHHPAVRLCEAGSGPARTAVRAFSALPDGLRAMTDWLCEDTALPPPRWKARGLLEGSVRGAGRSRHPRRPAPCPARQADPRQEDRYQRQPVAGPHLSVRPRPAELRPAASVPSVAPVDPLSPQARRRAQSGPKPRPQDARPRRSPARRRVVGHLRRQRAAGARRACRRALAAMHPRRAHTPRADEAGPAGQGPGRHARPARAVRAADAGRGRRSGRRRPGRTGHAHPDRPGRLSAPRAAPADDSGNRPRQRLHDPGRHRTGPGSLPRGAPPGLVGRGGRRATTSVPASAAPDGRARETRRCGQR